MHRQKKHSCPNLPQSVLNAQSTQILRVCSTKISTAGEKISTSMLAVLAPFCISDGQTHFTQKNANQSKHLKGDCLSLTVFFASQDKQGLKGKTSLFWPDMHQELLLCQIGSICLLMDTSKFGNSCTSLT